MPEDAPEPPPDPPINGMAGLMKPLVRRPSSWPQVQQRPEKLADPGLIGRLLDGLCGTGLLIVRCRWLLFRLLTLLFSDSWYSRSSSISSEDSDSDRWRHSASRRSTSICSFRCSLMFSSRILFSSATNCCVAFCAFSRFERSCTISERRVRMWLLRFEAVSLVLPFSVARISLLRRGGEATEGARMF